MLVGRDRRTCAAGVIEDSDALFEEPGGDHGTSDLLCASLDTGVVRVVVCYSVKVVPVCCFVGVCV